MALHPTSWWYTDENDRDHHTGTTASSRCRGLPTVTVPSYTVHSGRRNRPTYSIPSAFLLYLDTTPVYLFRSQQFPLYHSTDACCVDADRYREGNEADGDPVQSGDLARGWAALDARPGCAARSTYPWYWLCSRYYYDRHYCGSFHKHECSPWI